MWKLLFINSLKHLLNFVADSADLGFTENTKPLPFTALKTRRRQLSEHTESQDCFSQCKDLGLLGERVTSSIWAFRIDEPRMSFPVMKGQNPGT